MLPVAVRPPLIAPQPFFLATETQQVTSAEVLREVARAAVALTAAAAWTFLLVLLAA
jgi:hypothetical protein